ncbi:hypothetical protein C1H46_026476 [Malus baccata]|uniref:GOLD domain-containing protein n=1 Tax=Malus baccata TaxID=106549 RepID=A0A540LNK6_MALBA|nr:hypothetical protein C1H46_026476 [Malus baccata]
MTRRSWGGSAVAAAILLVLCLARTGQAIWVTLPSSGTKCVSEEIQNNVVVLADYVVIPDDHSHSPTISAKPFTKEFLRSRNGVSFTVKVIALICMLGCRVTLTPLAGVTSPYGNNLHQMENATHGQFAFTTHEAGNYLACFWVDGNNPGGGGVSVNLDWKTGIAAKDWESVARKEKIEGLELELRKLEGAVEAIHENLLYLKGRESEMRDVSERTNARVAWFSMMSLAVCIIVSTLQLWHLKNFFQKKKLI